MFVCACYFDCLWLVKLGLHMVDVWSSLDNNFMHKDIKRLRCTGICIHEKHTHLDRGHTQALRERLTSRFPSRFRYVCLHSLYRLLSSVNLPFSEHDRTENKTQKHSRKRERMKVGRLSNQITRNMFL